MPFKRKCIGVTSFHRGIDIQFRFVSAVWVGLHRINGPSSDTRLAMAPKRVELSPEKFPGHVALSAEVFGPNFRASQLHTIPKGVHFRPAHVNGVYQFMGQNRIGVFGACDVFLAQVNFRFQIKPGGSVLVSLKLIHYFLSRFGTVWFFSIRC
jgi:hypothetical protein